MRLLPRTRPGRLLALAVVVGVAVAAAVAWRGASTSDPVEEAEALQDFRSGPAGAAVAGAPSPGVYAYRASGRERGGVGPLAISRDLPAVARMVVTPAPGGWEAELSYSRQHVEATRYSRSPSGEIRATWRRTEVTFAGFGRDDRRDVEPPSLVLPADPAPGDAWSETYRTGDITVRARTRIERAETVRVGGRPIDTLVLRVESTTDGPHPGTRAETLWWAPAVGLPVRWDVDMDIGGTFAFRATSRIDLVSASPEV
jgi:hypothetical protein